MDWIRRTFGRGRRMGQGGDNGSRRAEDETAEWQVQRQAEIAEARRAAFDGASGLPMREVRPGLPADGLVYTGVDHLDRLVIVTSTADPAETYAGRDATPGWASFPHSAAAGLYAVEIHTIEPDGSSFTLDVPGLGIAYPQFQPLPEGRFLAVGVRCRLTEEGPEHNAVVLSADGAVAADFCLGDGINEVQTTATGKIWVGYHDEGVFGNFGWGEQDGPPPLGRSGLVCWSAKGEKELEFSPPDGLPPIADCYALNVIDEEAWACYYTDFPVVRVGSDGSATGWISEIAGVNALAVLGAARVAFVGGHGGLFDRLITADLTTEVAGAHVLQLQAPDGRDLPQGTRVLARGQRLHALTDGRWLTIDLGDIPR